ncbi:MAG: glycosyltransferase family 39 protein [Bryobacterales bacterium]|nr:glycosyltransferase family 39 protein [Bryobacterales bacterium]MBV9402017.1 glycosyltransferase family 39 protein [Bryobacterales bacterium]
MPSCAPVANRRWPGMAQTAVVFVLLISLSLAAVSWTLAQGYTLYYGDAEAHLNIARRVLDSRTPGPEQFGTVWLPLPHLLMLPFVARDSLWRNGLAGAIPSAAAYVLAGTFLFAAARRAYDSTAAAVAVAAAFAINPNLLYLQSTPMTEALFLAALMALLWATLWFRESQSPIAVLTAAAASCAASLTRYEGWLLIPFVTLHFLITAKRKRHAIVFGVLASLAPLAWLAHNQFYYSNALEFFNGPYSAAAIYWRQKAAGMSPYPGDHDWLAAIKYYFAAAKLVCGPVLLILGAAGTLAIVAKRIFWPLLFLAIPPAFYIWSMHSFSAALFVPNLWPFSWYNTRYAITVLPFAAFACGALVLYLPARTRYIGALAIAAGTITLSSVCWKESQVNSSARRDWTHQAAAYLAANYRAGEGILYSFGDLTGILREAGIPLRETLHDGNHPAWEQVTARPDLFLGEQWALAFAGDPVSKLAARRYRMKKQMHVEGSPDVEIYHREP